MLAPAAVGAFSSATLKRPALPCPALPHRALRCPGGNDQMMRLNHFLWQRTTEKMKLLKANPRKFVRRYGDDYNINAS